MTLIQFALLLAVLALLLGWLLLRLLRELRKSRNADSGRKEHRASHRGKHRPAEAKEPKPAPDKPAQSSESRPDAAPAPVRRRRIVGEPVPEKGDLPAASPPVEGLYAEVEAKLTQAFDLLERGRISVDRYELLVLKEQEAIKRARARFTARAMTLPDAEQALAQEREDLETAEVAVQWCLDWIGEFRRGDAKPL